MLVSSASLEYHTEPCCVFLKRTEKVCGITHGCSQASLREGAYSLSVEYTASVTGSSPLALISSAVGPQCIQPAGTLDSGEF